MDVNRYYVPPRPRKASTVENISKHTAATSRFAPVSKRQIRLPTPQAFFERQQKFKDADQKAMMRFAHTKTVKHNLKLRRKVLQSMGRTQDKRREIDNQKSMVKLLADKMKVKSEKAKEKKKLSHGLKFSTEKGKDESGQDTERFHLEHLEAALDEENEHEINRSVLENFFDLKDPSRIDEIDDLLEEYNGREFDLFDSIAKKYKVVASRNRSSKQPDNTRTARQSLASLRSNLKRTGSHRSFRMFETEAEKQPETRPHASSFVETSVDAANLLRSSEGGTEAPAPEKYKPGHLKGRSRNSTKVPKSPPRVLPDLPDLPPRRAWGSFAAAKSMNRQRSALTMGASVYSIESTPEFESESDELKAFQRSLDAEIKQKLYRGEYVTSIMAAGGRWWVNREDPKKHPSQRKRDTLLEDLRNGTVPLSV